jgi:YfiH family protein
VRGIVRERRRGRLVWLSLDLLETRGVDHGFTLRYGGVSRGGVASLNFTSRQGDLPERVRENWRRLEAAAGLPAGRWSLVSQVHGTDVVRAGRGRKPCHHRRTCPPADALVTTDPGVTVAVLTADCLPVILAAPGGRAAAVAHAGWRGALAGVVPRAVASLAAAGGAEPGDLAAGLGPAIGSCCFQVGEEVYEAFRKERGLPFARRVFQREDPWLLDLRQVCRIDLIEAGLREKNIDGVPLCTSCRRDLFFSHRRDGEPTGRMLAFARCRVVRE